MEIAGLDDFKYRYYVHGPYSDMVSLPTDPRPATSDYPFAMKCYKGCTYTDLENGESWCTGGSDGYTSDYAPVATAGVVDVYVSAPASAAGLQCSADDDGTSAADDADDEDDDNSGPSGGDDGDDEDADAEDAAAALDVPLTTAAAVGVLGAVFLQ